MQAKFDTVTYEEEHFSLTCGRQINPDGLTFVHPKSLGFKSESMYQLFKTYLNQSFIVNCRGVEEEKTSLATYAATFDDDKKEVQIGSCFGADNILGKFFLETDLDWPEEFYRISEINRQSKQFLMRFESHDVKGHNEIALGRQGTANIPQDIIIMLNSYQPLSEIKRVAPLLLQDCRTSFGKGFFTNLKRHDFLITLSPFLSPELSSDDAVNKMREELNKAEEFYQTNHQAFFAYDKESIQFSSLLGTHIGITTDEHFKAWFQKFPLKQSVILGDYQVYKLNSQKIAINQGSGTKGIQIIAKDQGFLICNNITSDREPTQREENILWMLTALNILIGLLAFLRVMFLKKKPFIPMKETALFSSKI